MRISGQFVLFETIDEFKKWLFDTKFNRNIIKIQQHHTWKPNYSQFTGNNHFELLKSMKDYHVNTNGWADIGQNLTSFPDGTIALCRSFEKDPAGIYGQNTGAICLENVGDFDVENMTEKQKKSIVKLTALFIMRFDLKADTNSIIYHSWFSEKTCPGLKFFGGNTVEACVNNFLPLVKEVMQMFKDDADISLWAKDDVYKLKELGIFNGDDKGNFNPKDSISREAVAKVMCNLLRYLGKI